MHLPTTLQGRPFGPEQLAQIQSLLDGNSPWSRYRLSRELAVLWNWRTAQGQLKDMAARTLLLKLEEQGWIRLPQRRRKSPTHSGQARVGNGLALDESPVECPLEAVVPLQLHEVSQQAQQRWRVQLEACLDRYHYLGYRNRVGQNLQYWVCDGQDRPVACVVFGSDCEDAVGSGPKCQGAQILAAIRRFAPNKAIERKILYDNAKKVLKM